MLPLKLENGGLQQELAELPCESPVLITSGTSAAALQVLTMLLAAHLRIKHDFWVDPIPARPPFIVHLNPDLPVETLDTLYALVASIPNAMMC